jgi:hypothetical protein
MWLTKLGSLVEYVDLILLQLHGQCSKKESSPTWWWFDLIGWWQ